MSTDLFTTCSCVNEYPHPSCAVCHGSGRYIQREITDTDRLEWLERNLLQLHTQIGVTMNGKKFTGQMHNEARWQGGGSSYFSIKHNSLREAVDAAMISNVPQQKP